MLKHSLMQKATFLDRLSYEMDVRFISLTTMFLTHFSDLASICHNI